MTGARAPSPALLYVPLDGSTRTRFRVLTPDLHAVATTVEPALAAATALAVARHHRRRYATVAASDGRWLDVHLDGRCVITPPSSMTGWPAAVMRALGRLAPTTHADTGNEP